MEASPANLQNLDSTKGLTESQYAQLQDEMAACRNNLRQQEIFWKQKSRFSWLQEGDSNSQFFHRTVKVRRAKNLIGHVVDDNGAVHMDRDGISQVILNCFKEKWTRSNVCAIDHNLLCSSRG